MDSLMEAVMDTRLKQTIARIRKDIRVLSREIQTLIDRDEDCTHPAQQIIRAQADLRHYLDRN
jgi:hypothetical protein